MITPSPLYEPYDGGVVEPHQEEQDWLRNEQGEQDWLRAEQGIFTVAGRTLPPPEHRHETLDGLQWLA